MKKYLKVEEVAKLLKISEETVRRYLRSGKLKAHKLNNNYLIEQKHIDSLLGEKPPVEKDNKPRPPKPPKHHHEHKPKKHHDSVLSETLIVSRKHIHSIQEILDLTRELDPGSLDLMETIKETDKDKFIDRFVEAERKINAASVEKVKKAIEENSASVVFPLPPHIVDELAPELLNIVAISSEEKVPPHLRRWMPVCLNADNQLEVANKIKDVNTLIIDGQRKNGSMFVRSNVAGLIDSLSHNNLTNIYLHRIPHIPPKQRFVELSLSDYPQLVVETI